MNKEDYPKCRTCRHLNPFPDTEAGWCTRISWNGGKDDVATLSGADEGVEVLEVYADKFGCILHEPITTDLP
jgi:hypothetical protein